MLDSEAFVAYRRRLRENLERGHGGDAPGQGGSMMQAIASARAGDIGAAALRTAGRSPVRPPFRSRGGGVPHHWQLAPELGSVNGRFTSQPCRVFAAAVEIIPDGGIPRKRPVSACWNSCSASPWRWPWSVPLGALLGTSKYARHLIDPPLMALYIAPTLVAAADHDRLAGHRHRLQDRRGLPGRLFPIVVNTMAGMRETDAS